ncbi:hypothetical protein RJ639_013197 [Escallonia herrerae]|uniref:Transposase (putative) gypsy type domain-containing protein n=1 Tax=Escallonia herrerae TaxID=1293975 RepID=A0AA88VL26_9ASTE|nr:hypothetical protein RJ639_013197 [Escallonia herrerae]
MELGMFPEMRGFGRDLVLDDGENGSRVLGVFEFGYMSSTSSSSSSSPSTRRSQVGTSTPQANTLFSSRDALGEIKDEAEDKFDEDTWFSADEKRKKMTKESIVELLEEFPLPPPFSARVPALQEPTNYGTDLEASVYEHQIRSGYRVPMHPFAVAFFNRYKMASGQLVPNGWRKLVGLIYLVQTSGYPVTIHDFMRLYLEVCFIKNVANSVEMIGKGGGAKGDFLGLLEKAFKGKRKGKKVQGEVLPPGANSSSASARG